MNTLYSGSLNLKNAVFRNHISYSPYYTRYHNPNTRNIESSRQLEANDYVTWCSISVRIPRVQFPVMLSFSGATKFILTFAIYVFVNVRTDIS